MEEEVVTHRVFGRGTVRGRRARGFEVFVEFEGGRKEWVKVHQLTWTDPTFPNAGRTIADKGPAFTNRRLIEALRLGIVPVDCVSEFTYGRDEELRRFKSWLARPEQSVLLVIGHYGIGKTHLLRYFRTLGLEDGFAVANVEIDPNETPFGKPKRIYSAIVRTFAFKDDHGHTAGFRDFVRKSIVKGFLTDHPYFRRLRGGLDDQTLWDWIEARESAARPPLRGDFPRLPDTSTAMNVYCNLLSAIGWASTPVFGLKGLLILFDETEALDIGTYYQRRKGNEFFEALLGLALEREVGDCLGGNAAGGGRRRDPWIAELPFLYRTPTRLRIVLAVDLGAFADIILLLNKKLGLDVIGGLTHSEESASVRILVVREMGPDVKRALFNEVFRRYASAYGVEVDRVSAVKTLEGAPGYDGEWRRFVKAVIESLDLVRHGMTSEIAGLR